MTLLTTIRIFVLDDQPTSLHLPRIHKLESPIAVASSAQESIMDLLVEVAGPKRGTDTKVRDVGGFEQWGPQTPEAVPPQWPELSEDHYVSPSSRTPECGLFPAATFTLSDRLGSTSMAL